MALAGLRVIELAGLAPVPLVGLMLADGGATVIRVDRPKSPFIDVLARGKRSIMIDMKQPRGVDIVRTLCRSSDVLLSPYRPGVLDSLGLAPRDLARIAPQLIVAPLYGYHPSSSMAASAGHDINYLSMTGLLSLMHRPEHRGSHTPPLNVLGDFGGGSAMAMIGILTALLQRAKDGKGRTVTTSITDGTAYLASLLYNVNAMNGWSQVPFLRPGAAAYYDTYATRDGRHVAVGAIETPFFAQLLAGLQLPREEWAPRQMDEESQAALRAAIATAFAAHDLKHWMTVFGPDGVCKDACVTPVLSMEEGAEFLRTRRVPALSGAEHGATTAPRPATGVDDRPPAAHSSDEEQVVLPGQHTREVLSEFGFSEHDAASLEDARVVTQARGVRAGL